MTLRHLPAEPIDGVQACDWCQRVLVDRPIHRSQFYRPGEEIVEDGIVMRGRRDDDDLVPRCIPEVDNVDVR